VNKLLASKFSDFIDELTNIVKQILLFYNLLNKQVKSNYYFFIIELFALVKNYSYKYKLNREKSNR
jgi:hypothetical protein